MAKVQTSAFQRMVSARDLFRGRGRSALLLAGIASILLCLLLFDLSLIVDLLANQGRLLIPKHRIAALNERAGTTIIAPALDVDLTTGPELIELENTGILPAIHSAGDDRSVGRLLAFLYARVPPLRNDAGALGVLMLAAVVLGALRNLLLSLARTQSMRAALDAVARSRRSIHRQTLRLGPSDLDGTQDRYALKLFTSDTDLVQEGAFQWIYRLARYPVELALLLAVAFWLHWLLALECIIPLALCWYLIEREQIRFGLARDGAEKNANQQLQVLAEGLRKTRLVRGYGMENVEHEQFQQHLNRFRTNLESLIRGEVWSHWARWLMVIVFLVLVFYLVGMKVLLPGDDPERMPFAKAFVFLGAFACMYRPLEKLWQLGDSRLPAEEAAQRTHDYLQRIPEVGQAVGARFLQPLSKSLQFESVVYAMPGSSPVLNGFDLKLQAGSVTAIVSLDPREARAVAYMLPRFIEPQSGRVLFDGEDIAWVTLESLRAEAIYVGGNDPAFTGTVFQNISCGNPGYTLQDVTEAAKQMHAHNFVAKLPLGYETVLGEYGHPLDPGESLRLSLARAVLRNPALLIIEEPAELIDDDGKALLDDAYARVDHERTVIFLPSRLSTLRKADQIVLVHEGRVAAIDQYNQLVKSSQLYRHWEYTRFNEFRNHAVSGK